MHTHSKAGLFLPPTQPKGDVPLIAHMKYKAHALSCWIKLCQCLGIPRKKEVVAGKIVQLTSAELCELWGGKQGKVGTGLAGAAPSSCHPHEGLWGCLSLTYIGHWRFSEVI